MSVIVKKWEIGASVRIPVAITQTVNRSLDEAMGVSEEGGRIVIEPVHPGEDDLARLLAGITKKNMHTEVSFGPAVGKEMS